jgi:hypothetical protein
MYKKILFTICLLLLLPTTASAHTGLESSTPADKETITKPLNEIVLQFNTNIENLSTFTLTDKQGQKMKVDDIKVEQKKLVGTFNDPLPNGDYTVNYKIVGEDGHIIERSISFFVNMPNEVKQTQPTEQMEKAPSPQDNRATSETKPVQPAKNKSSNFSLVAISLGAIILIIILGIIIRRRK